jgi:hypothetical protein
MTRDDGQWKVESTVILPNADQAREFHAGLCELAQALDGTCVERHIGPHPFLQLVENDQPRGAA